MLRCVVHDQRDGDGDEQRVAGGESRPTRGENDQGNDRDREHQSGVPRRHEPLQRDVQTAAELAEQGARAIAHAARHMARSAGRCVEPDECKAEADGNRGRHGDGPSGQPPGGESHPEDGAARRHHDQAAAVCSRLAPADGDERQRRDGREAAQAERRPREQRHGDDDRRREIRRAVEAAALVRRGADGRQRSPRRLGDEHDEVCADERGEEHRQRLPVQQAPADDAEPGHDDGQRGDEHGRLCHVQPRQSDGDGEREGSCQQTRAADARRPEHER